MWRFLLALHAATPGAGWDAVGRWPLIPSTSAGGSLVRVAARALVLCPPEPPLPEALLATEQGAVIPDSVAEAQPVTATAEAMSEGEAEDVRAQDESQPLLAAAEEETPAEEPSSMQGARPAAESANESQPGRPSCSEEALAEYRREQQRPWPWLLPMAERLALPVLDARFAHLRGTCLPDGQGELPQQDLLLRKLRLCCQAGLFQVRCLLLQ